MERWVVSKEKATGETTVTVEVESHELADSSTDVSDRCPPRRSLRICDDLDLAEPATDEKLSCSQEPSSRPSAAHEI